MEGAIHMRAHDLSRSDVIAAVALPASSAAPSTLILAVGKVTAQRDGCSLEVETADRALRALVGYGCLVRPIAGDRVLLSISPEGTYVIAVLERLLPDAASLALPAG